MSGTLQHDSNNAAGERLAVARRKKTYPLPTTSRRSGTNAGIPGVRKESHLIMAEAKDRQVGEPDQRVGKDGQLVLAEI